MTTITNKLSDPAVKNAKPGAAPYKLFDGEGLFLLVQPTGGKLWRLKYRFGAKEKLLALGAYPEIKLKEARDKRKTARDQIANGIDPGMARKAEKASRIVNAEGSFEAVAREWHGHIHTAKVSEGHAARTLIRLEQDVFPFVGSLPIADITAPVLLLALRKIEARGAIETAHRAMQASGQVFRYGIATGRCTSNPAADLRDALKPVQSKNMAAITDPKAVGALLRSIDDYQGLPVTRAALQLAPLVFVRPGELRGAEWAEIDLDAGVWAIASHRMKRKKEDKAKGAAHIVPLSHQAVAVLRDIYPLTGHGRFVFPSPRTSERCMSENGVLSALRRMGYAKDEMTGHGFRAMASTMLNEMGFRADVIEAQLAHTEEDEVRGAYNRAKYIEERKAMMQAWADYLDKLRKGGEVIPFKMA
jgi:integrase